MTNLVLTLGSDTHPESVLNSMQTIMVVLLDESEEVHEDLLLVLFSVLGRNKKVCIFATYWLAFFFFLKLEIASILLEYINHLFGNKC